MNIKPLLLILSIMLTCSCAPVNTEKSNSSKQKNGKTPNVHHIISNSNSAEYNPLELQPYYDRILVKLKKLEGLNDPEISSIYLMIDDLSRRDRVLISHLERIEQKIDYRIREARSPELNKTSRMLLNKFRADVNLIKKQN